jgi:hypothetical protein
MPSLRFRPGFDAMLLSWGGPDEAPSEQCSICDAPLEDVPLIIWRSDGWCVRICDACVARWIVAGS